MFDPLARVDNTLDDFTLSSRCHAVSFRWAVHSPTSFAGGSPTNLCLAVRNSGSASLMNSLMLWSVLMAL